MTMNMFALLMACCVAFGCAAPVDPNAIEDEELALRGKADDGDYCPFNAVCLGEDRSCIHSACAPRGGRGDACDWADDGDCQDGLSCVYGSCEACDFASRDVDGGLWGNQGEAVYGDDLSYFVVCVATTGPAHVFVDGTEVVSPSGWTCVDTIAGPLRDTTTISWDVPALALANYQITYCSEVPTWIEDDYRDFSL
jgi:hypothetical protein